MNRLFELMAAHIRRTRRGRTGSRYVQRTRPTVEAMEDRMLLSGDAMLVVTAPALPEALASAYSGQQASPPITAGIGVSQLVNDPVLGEALNVFPAHIPGEEADGFTEWSDCMAKSAERGFGVGVGLGCGAGAVAGAAVGGALGGPAGAAVGAWEGCKDVGTAGGAGGAGVGGVIGLGYCTGKEVYDYVHDGTQADGTKDQPTGSEADGQKNNQGTTQCTEGQGDQRQNNQCEDNQDTNVCEDPDPDPDPDNGSMPVPDDFDGSHGDPKAFGGGVYHANGNDLSTLVSLQAGQELPAAGTSASFQAAVSPAALNGAAGSLAYGASSLIVR